MNARERGRGSGELGCLLNGHLHPLHHRDEVREPPFHGTVRAEVEVLEYQAYGAGVFLVWASHDDSPPLLSFELGSGLAEV